MEALGPERLKRTHVEIFQNVERHQRGEALPVRRQFAQVKAAVIRRNGRRCLALVRGDVGGRDQRAARGERLHHVVGDLAFVESARAFSGDGLQRLRQRRQTNDIAFLRHGAVGQKMPGEAGIGLDPRRGARPVEGDALRDGKTALGVIYRRPQRPVEPDGAVRPQRCVPSLDRAGHGDGMDRGADLA
jgi:hypothetical protein